MNSDNSNFHKSSQLNSFKRTQKVNWNAPPEKDSSYLLVNYHIPNTEKISRVMPKNWELWKETSASITNVEEDDILADVKLLYYLAKEDLTMTNMYENNTICESYKFPLKQQNNENILHDFPIKTYNNSIAMPYKQSENLNLITISDEEDEQAHKILQNVPLNTGSETKSKAKTKRLLSTRDSIEKLKSKTKLTTSFDVTSANSSSSSQQSKPKTANTLTLKQRQIELHQKRLELLEVKLARERNEFLHEQLLFEKELELKNLKLRRLTTIESEL